MNNNKEDIEKKLIELHKQLIYEGSAKKVSKQVSNLLPELHTIAKSGNSELLAFGFIILADCCVYQQHIKNCKKNLETASQYISEKTPALYQFKYTTTWAEYYQMTGESAKSTHWMLQGVKVAKESGDNALIIMTLANAGIMYIVADDLEMAAKFLSEAISLTPKEERSSKAGHNFLGMGTILEKSGGKDEAVKYFLNARNCFKAVGDTTDECITYAALASCLMDTDIDRAERYINEGLQIIEVGKDGNTGGDLLITAAGIKIRKKEYQEAEALIKKCDEQYVRGNETTPVFIGMREALADLYSATENFVSAEKELHSLLKLAQEMKSLTLIGTTYKRLAELAKIQGRYEEFAKYIARYYDTENEKTKAFLKRRIEVVDLEIQNLRQKQKIEQSLLREQELHFTLKMKGLKSKQLEEQLALKATTLASQTELLANFREDLRRILRKIEVRDPAINELRAKLRELPETVNWKEFDEQFQQVHPEFKIHLKKKFSQLSDIELQICALLRLKLKSQDISRLLSLARRTVENHRHRIRKKLKIGKEDDIAIFLGQF